MRPLKASHFRCKLSQLSYTDALEIHVKPAHKCQDNDDFARASMPTYAAAPDLNPVGSSKFEPD